MFYKGNSMEEWVRIRKACQENTIIALEREKSINDWKRINSQPDEFLTKRYAEKTKLNSSCI